MKSLKMKNSSELLMLGTDLKMGVRSPYPECVGNVFFLCELSKGRMSCGTGTKPRGEAEGVIATRASGEHGRISRSHSCLCQKGNAGG